MKNIYIVYGRRFTNKRNAIKYHKQIYGNCDYQASTVYVWDGGELISVRNLADVI